MSATEKGIEVSRADQINAAGAQLFGQGQIEPARLHFLAALVLEPNHAMALQNLGAALRNLGHFAASEVVAKRSVAATKGENPYCLSNLGVAQLGMKKYQEALRILGEVAKSLPESSHSWHNCGLVHYMLGQHKEALEMFEKSLLLKDDIQVKSDRALTLLSLGRIQQGLEAYEDRWELLKKNKVWELNIPEWKGESLEGCRILLHHEQGFGDSIMLVRFIKLLARYKCAITLAVPQPLVRLFQRSFQHITVVDIEDEALYENGRFEYHSPLLSVMRWTGVASPKDISFEPYLFARPQGPTKLPDARAKIGICWASGNHSPQLLDRRRLVPITQFLPFLEEDGLSVISLQKGDDTKDLVANGLEGLIFDISPRLEDFATTADTIACLDLVISVDSAVAHLAGALGKPCLMLSPFSRCWRWWARDTGWPWYGRMRLFHQSQDGTWDEAMQKVIQQAKWVVDRHTQ